MSRKMKCKLYSFQKEGVERGIKTLERHKCLLLCDEQGLGKTVESLAMISKMKHIKRVLVICPTFAVFEWCRILEEKTGMSYCAIDDNNDMRNRAFVNIIGYDRYRIIGDSFPYSRYDIVICDEFQFMKNPEAQQTKAVRSHRYKYVIMASGTPILNQPSELWAPMDYCLPKKFGTYDRFFRRYTRTRKIKIWIQPKYRRGFHKFIDKPSGTKNAKELRAYLKPIMIRRLKKDVLTELPDKIWQNMHVQLTGKQLQVYQRIRRKLLRKIDGKKINIINALARFGLLRRICCAYQDGGKVYSSKLAVLKDLVDDIIRHKHKVFIAVPYIAVAEMIAEELKDYGVVCITSKTRDVITKQEGFQKRKGKPRVYVGTIGKHQGAITLTAANYIIFFGKDLVPNRNRQVEDRLHRIGQKDVVNVINILAKDTVDDKIEEMLSEKEGIVNNILAGSGKITLRDIGELIR